MLSAADGFVDAEVKPPGASTLIDARAISVHARSPARYSTASYSPRGRRLPRGRNVTVVGVRSRSALTSIVPSTSASRPFVMSTGRASVNVTGESPAMYRSDGKLGRAVSVESPDTEGAL